MKQKKQLSIELEKIFDKEYEGFCYQNCIREILNFYGCEEYDFYINMSLSTRMVIEEGKYYISYDKNAHGIIPSEADKVHRKNDGRDSETVLAENLRRVEEGYPIIVCADGYYLSYFSYYREKHCRHNMILSGEENTGNITVLDWYTPHFYCGEIARKEFLMARESSNPDDGSIYSGAAIRNNWALVDRDGWNQHAEDLIYENLELSVRQYFPSGIADGSTIYGVSVYRKIKTEFEKIVFLEQKERREKLRYAHNKLYQTVKRKYLFRYFLGLIHDRTGESDLTVRTMKYLQNLINQWERFMTVLLKSSFRGKEADILKLVDMLKSLIDMEEGLYDYVLCLRNSV